MSIFKYQAGLLWVSLSTISSEPLIKLHTHEFCHLFYVKEGCCKATIGEKEYIINPGQGFLALEGVAHKTISINEDTPSRCIEFKFVILDKDFHSDLENLPSVFTVDDFGKNLLSNIIQCSKIPSDSMVNRCGVYFISFLFAIMDPSLSKSVQANKNEKSPVEKIINYVEEHYTQPLLLEEIAKYVGYNKSYICTLFKNEKGITINDYLNNIRIQRACYLISYSNIGLKEIAKQTGFTSIHYFSRIFKESVGISPGQYRSRILPEYMEDRIVETITGDPNTDDFISAILAHRTVTPSEEWNFIKKNPSHDENDQ